ncbi:MAG: thioredoxin family protein [Verrucomicrobia bacterium]|nr:MAG: thioredoxin family protein [Verrucomicrobiota bacterium]
MRRASFVPEPPRLAENGKLPETSPVKPWRLFSLAAVLLIASCSKKAEPVATAEVSPTPSLSAKPGWLTSYEQAQKEAQASHRLLLMDFTGSDWCGWCIMLDKEVFSKPEFKEYASKNLVLLELDFPRAKRMPPETAKQNEQLALKYGIQGFPTVVVFDSNGKPLGALGYQQGGPQAFIAQLEKLRKG